MIDSRKQRQSSLSLTSSSFLLTCRQDRWIILLLLSLLGVISLASSTPLHATASSIVSNPSFVSRRTTRRRPFLPTNLFSGTSIPSHLDEEGEDQKRSTRRTSTNQHQQHKRMMITVKTRGGGGAGSHVATTTKSIWHYLKISFAGGIAGAVGSTALYPMDAAKTLRQSNPSEYSSVFHALRNLLYTTTTGGKISSWHIQRVYRGVLPAAIGAIPSSCLYFGAYESMKAVLKHKYPLEGDSTPTDAPRRKNNFRNRLLVHGLAAMSGNVLSSAIFVPKELIKQQLQYNSQLSGNVWNVIVDILKTKGLGGLYVGYKATLMRNIPSAILRFSLYEEFRYRWTTNGSNNNQQTGGGGGDPRFFLAGAAAGILASGIMTPVDVLKTRLATGTCSVAASTSIQNCFWGIVQEEGIVGLYSGAGSRMIFSGAFSAIGFGTFEWAKGVLGVQTTASSSTAPTTPKRRKKSMSSRQESEKHDKQIIASSSSSRPKTKAAAAAERTREKNIEKLKPKQEETRLLSTRKPIAAST